MTDSWQDAQQAAALFALDPAAIGGIALRAPPGPLRDRWLALLGTTRKLPANIAEDRLLGGLDLPATLAAGAPRHTRGALAEAEGGIILLAMAERLPPATAAHIAQAQDNGARFGFVLLDEGIDEERPPAILMERAAIHLDLTAIPLSPTTPNDLDPTPDADLEDAALEALCTTALALGIPSARAPLLAARVARAAAAAAGHPTATPEDVALAARLVLAPRATTLPAEAPPPEPPPEPETPPPPDDPTQTETLADQILDAARAAIPPGLLALLASAAPRPRTQGRAGAPVKGPRGRPTRTRPGLPRDGLRLDLVETLRAAAPWQRLRAASGPRTPVGAPLIRIRRDDLRITHREQKAGTTTIFLVDASGSHALNRLAEAKGAVELLLADCYVRRDQVAVLAFRGKAADLLLPPTRSLVRAKRSLAGLPGGGGTPLATALDAALLLADTIRRQGNTPTLVLLTDGQANVARNGAGGRTRAREEALAAAKTLRTANHATLFVDTAPRPTQAAKDLATTMNARYLPLPYANAQTLSTTIRGLK